MFDTYLPFKNCPITQIIRVNVKNKIKNKKQFES